MINRYIIIFIYYVTHYAESGSVAELESSCYLLLPQLLQ